MKEESGKLITVMKSIAKPVDEKATDAATLAGLAQLAAESALESAGEASQSAEDAIDAADEAKDLAIAAGNAADRAEAAAAAAAKTATDYILPILDQQGNVTEVILNTEKAESMLDISNASARLTENSLDIYVDDQSIASYGATARIGLDRKIEISPQNIKMFDNTDNTIFDVKASTVTNINKSEHHRFKEPYPGASNYTYSLRYEPVEGSTISLDLGYFQNPYSVPPDSWNVHFLPVFVGGTASSETSQEYISVSQNSSLYVTVSYDGNKTFLIKTESKLRVDPIEVQDIEAEFNYTASEVQYPKYTIGLGLENDGTDTQIVVGQYNETSLDQIFTVGAGADEDNRFTLLSLHKPNHYPPTENDITMRLKGTFISYRIADNSILDEPTIQNWSRIILREREPGDEETGWVNDILNHLVPQIIQVKMDSATTISSTSATQITALESDISIGNRITFDDITKRFYIGEGVNVVKVSFMGTSSPVSGTTQRWLRINVRKNGSNIGPYNQQYMTSGGTATFIYSALINVTEDDYIDFTTQTGNANTVNMQSGFTFTIESLA